MWKKCLYLVKIKWLKTILQTFYVHTYAVISQTHFCSEHLNTPFGNLQRESIKTTHCIARPLSKYHNVCQYFCVMPYLKLMPIKCIVIAIQLTSVNKPAIIILIWIAKFPFKTKCIMIVYSLTRMQIRYAQFCGKSFCEICLHW